LKKKGKTPKKLKIVYSNLVEINISVVINRIKGMVQVHLHIVIIKKILILIRIMIMPESMESKLKLMIIKHKDL